METLNAHAVDEGGRSRLGTRLASIDWAENILLAALVGVFIWRGFFPAWRSLNTDFPNYYLAARLS